MNVNILKTLSVVLMGLSAEASADTVTFGAGSNSFNLDFVSVGNAGNSADNTGYGSVGYFYQMGTFEVSRDMINKYNASEGTLPIDLAFVAFLDGGERADMPATGMTWNEAARFVNWLNTSTGGEAAYKFDDFSAAEEIMRWSPEEPGYDASNEYRNSRAKYVLPSEDEWYKAAFYNGNGGYYNYAVQTDNVPTLVANGTAAGTAVGQQQWLQGPADIMSAGGLSHYGTMAQSGNVWEYTESKIISDNPIDVGNRIVRGGGWTYAGQGLNKKNSRASNDALTSSDINQGFRVAMLSSGANEYKQLERSNWVVSSTNNRVPVSRAIDGDPSTRWTTWQIQKPGQKFNIDLGSNQSFSRIELDTSASQKDYPRSYVVRASNDGTNYDQIAVGSEPGAITSIILADPVSYRYIQIEQTGNSTDSKWWSIHEINVYELTSPIRNEAALDRANWKLSSTNNRVPVSRAIDGDPSTRWTTWQVQQPGQKIIIDLGSNKLFTRIKLDTSASQDDYPRSYIVRGSLDGVNYIELAAGSEPGAVTNIILDFPGSYRYVQIEQTGNSTDSKWWSIHEVNVYEPVNVE